MTIVWSCNLAELKKADKRDLKSKRALRLHDHVRLNFKSAAHQREELTVTIKLQLAEFHRISV